MANTHEKVFELIIGHSSVTKSRPNTAHPPKWLDENDGHWMLVEDTEQQEPVSRLLLRESTGTLGLENSMWAL